MPPRCPRSVPFAGRNQVSVTTGAIPWWPRSAASTRTSSGSASCCAARRPGHTSAPAASRAARCRRPSDDRRGAAALNDLTVARELAHAALASLERSRERIDDLNVYPVPDGDTGTNMTLTARAVVEELDQTQTDERLALVKEVTRAALMGARGNSGVILSQIVRGAAEPLAANGHVDSETL